MKKFDVRLTKSFNNALLHVEGSKLEKTKLKKYLTVYNKGVGYQVKKAREQLEWIEPNHKAHPENPYFAQKYHDLKKNISELQDSIYEEYYTETDGGDLYIPAGFHYLGDCDYHLSDIKPIFPDHLRDYQREAVTAMLKYKRAVGVLATGLGKSLIILSICKSFLATNKRIIIIVPTVYLVDQVYDLLIKHHDSVTKAGGGNKPKLGSDILVSSMQSALQYVDSYDVILSDETHYSPTNTMEELFIAAEKAEYVYGLTATPFRLDGLQIAIHAYCGPIVYERDVKWGIENGWLMEPQIFMIKMHHKHPKVGSKSLAPSAYKNLCGSEYYISEASKQINKALAAGRRCIIITKTLAVAKAIQKRVSGSAVADAKYNKPLDDFRNNQIDALIATVKKVSEGVDIPNCDALFILTQHSSVTTTYQSLGRVLRISSGKKAPIVVDIAVTGFDQFNNAIDKRMDIYTYITKKVTLLG